MSTISRSMGWDTQLNRASGLQRGDVRIYVVNMGVEVVGMIGCVAQLVVSDGHFCLVMT